MVRKSPLDDPKTAAHAWRRYRRLLWLCFAVSLAAVALAFLYISSLEEPVSIHYYIAIAIGIISTIMMGGALMGLVFLSSGTGHDNSIED